MADDQAQRLRLLECWLPLAQRLGAAEGWGRDAPALEALVVRAAAALAQARTPLEAGAILRTYHTLSEAHPA